MLAKIEPARAKSYRPDALLPVNEGEAEWLLEMLKPLLEFYYVQPARLSPQSARRGRGARSRRAGATRELEEAEADHDCLGRGGGGGAGRDVPREGARR